MYRFFARLAFLLPTVIFVSQGKTLFLYFFKKLFFGGGEGGGLTLSLGCAFWGQVCHRAQPTTCTFAFTAFNLSQTGVNFA